MNFSRLADEQNHRFNSMKIVTYLLIIASMTSAFGQSKVALSLQVAPIYGHSDSRIRLGGVPATEITVVSNSLSYSAGLAIRYAFTSKWSVATGIWATHATTAKTELVQNGIPSIYRYSYNHPFTNSYKAPLLINYQVSTKRLSPYISLGATFDFRATSYVDLMGNNEYVAVKFGKPLVITPLVGLGMIYQATSHLAVVAQPTVQYDLQARPGYTFYHAYQLSLQSQLMYRF